MYIDHNSNTLLLYIYIIYITAGASRAADSCERVRINGDVDVDNGDGIKQPSADRDDYTRPVAIGHRGSRPARPSATNYSIRGYRDNDSTTATTTATDHQCRRQHWVPAVFLISNARIPADRAVYTYLYSC